MQKDYHSFPELIMPWVSYIAILIPYESINDPELDPAWWIPNTEIINMKREFKAKNQISMPWLGAWCGVWQIMATIAD
jgi:hypothetical protein